MRQIRTRAQNRSVFNLLLVLVLTTPFLVGFLARIRPPVSNVYTQSATFPWHAVSPRQAQGPGEREGLRFDHVFNTQTQNGGPILQDRDGFIWIGTSGSGLLRFDGYELKTYKPGGINPFPDAHVFDLYEDHDGQLWMLTQSSGLVRYDKNTDTFKTYTHDPQNPASISSNVSAILLSTGAIAEDADGKIWVGTQDGLNAFDKHTETFTRYLHDPTNPNSLSQNNVYAVVVDRQDRIWVGTNGGGLDRLDQATGTFTHFVSQSADEHSLISNVVYALLEDQDGVLWVGTDKGLHRFNSADGTFTRYLHDPANLNSPNSDIILTLHLDSRGSIWITYMLTERGGASAFDPRRGTFQHYLNDPANPNSLSTSSIDGVLEDRAGILWFVNDVGAVDKLDPNASRFVNYPASHFPDLVVSYLYEDSRQTLWISTFPKGLTAYDKTSRSFKQYLTDWHYSATYEDSAGNFWLGYTWPAGLALFDRDTGKIIKTFTNDPANPASMSANNNQIGAIVEDKFDHNLLWLGTYGAGVEQFNKKMGTFKHYVHDPHNPNSVINDVMSYLYQDKEGFLWLPTIGGLDRLDPRTDTFTHYAHNPNDPTSIGSDTTYTVFEDSAGRLWVGTALGFDLLDRETGKFTRYTRATGYPVTSIYSFAEDAAGNLWMGSYSGDGLIRFDPRTQTMRVFRQSDGLPTDIFGRGAVKDHDGEMWFGSFSGLTSFYPDEVGANPYVPPVHVTALKQGGEAMPLSQAPERVQSINLDWQHNYFEFEYTALNFTNPAKNQYQYKLEGLDKDWYNAGTRRFGRYSSLPGGTYTLHIKGSNNDGVWNETGVALNITVIPPFWEAWWFRGLVAFALVGLILGGFSYRTRSLRQHAQQLEREVAARTRELTETNRQLEIAKDAAQAAQRVAETANQAKSVFLANMSHELRTPLNAILGYAQILKRRPLDTDSSRGLNIIQQSGEHLLVLINDVLNLAQIEAGKLEIHPRPIGLPAFLEDIVGIIRARAEIKGLRVTFERPTVLPNSVQADETRLRQVLLNLLGNAIKFTDQGEIAFRIGATDVNEQQVRLHFEVADTGVGVAPDHVENIFQPFVQAGSQQRRMEGTGLGLTISRELIRSMGGDIHVTSEPGQGSTFWFDLVLPVVAIITEPRPSRGPHIVGYEGPRRKVLAVDDNANSRQVLISLLQPLGFELREADNGQAAIDRARDWQPDLILMDMYMPIMTGFDAAHAIRQHAELAATIIIGVSASVAEADTQHILEVGCNATLPKPVDVNQLLALIETHLHLTWIQAETTESASNAIEAERAIVLPPAVELEILYNLARRGNLQAIEERVAHLEQQDERLTPFAGQLRQLAQNFEDQALVALIQQYLERT